MMGTSQAESAPRPTLHADPDEIGRAIALLCEPGHVHELRALNTRKGTISGYYDSGHLSELANDAVLCSDEIRAAGTYVTLNACRPELLARSQNTAAAFAKHTTGDADITRRAWLPLDFDPIRPSGISASDAEHESALRRASDVKGFLFELGFPDPVYADSGNGSHLLYRIDLPNDDVSRDLVKASLNALALKFSDELVAVDRTTFNAARIWKLYGTVARKGSDIPDRPHRVARIIESPRTNGVVTEGQLRSLADLYKEPTRRTNGRSGYQPFGIEDWLAEHHVEVVRSEPWQGGQRFILMACLFDSAHGGTSAAILELPSGAIAYKCQHNGCADRSWSDVRTLLDPPYQKRGWEKQYTNGVTAHVEEAAASEASPEATWPDPLDDAAFRGIAGHIVETLAPATEADPVALLIQLLVGVGNVVGRSVYYEVEGARHHANLNAVVVGSTSKARKGSSWKLVSRPLSMVDSDWFSNRVLGGLSSGEGLIWQVRDKIMGRQPVRQDGRVHHYEEVETDAGVTDKRLLVHESEFAASLKVCERAGSILSELLRRAWDGDVLQSLTKNNPARASNPHISIVGHITIDELVRTLTDSALANGMANRFIFVVARRARLLPFGGDVPQDALVPLANELRDVIEHAQGNHRRIYFAEQTRRDWETVYPSLSSEHPGLLGAVIARAEAQVVRIALIYAILDKSREIEPEHLRSALAVWGYCEASAKYIFGDRLGDRDADAILDALRNRQEMTRKDIVDLFSRNVPADRLSRALNALVRAGYASCSMRQTAGRPAEVWKATMRTAA